MDLRYHFYIGGSPEQVWDALVAPEQVKKIMYGSVINSSFRVGDPLEYVGPGQEGDQTVHVYGKVLEYEPYKVFGFTHYAGKSYVPDGDKYESRITYRLDPVGACTRLTLIHDRWVEGDPSYENSDGAWWMILSNTKTLVETGKTLDMGY